MKVVFVVLASLAATCLLGCPEEKKPDAKPATTTAATAASAATPTPGAPKPSAAPSGGW